MKLGTLLLRNGALGLTQLEAALRNQVLYGGRLGTNLVELGFLDLDLLGVYLGEVCGLPVAGRMLLDSIPRDILNLLGSDLAHEWGALPLAWLAEDDAHQRRLAVAMTDPSSDVLRELVASQVGAEIVPYAIPELRAHYYLERHYGRPRSARFVRQGTRLTSTSPAERRRTQPAGGMVMPAPITVAPRSRRMTTVPPPMAPAVDAGLSFVDAVAHMARATDREQLADALVEFARGRLGALIVFIVRDGNAIGWRGHLATTIGEHARVDQLALPLAGVSVLQAAYDEARPTLGEPPSPGKTIERQLWTAIGAEPEPTELLVVPVVLRARVVNLIYAHGPGGAAMAPAVIQQLIELAEHAHTAYGRIIDHARRDD